MTSTINLLVPLRCLAGRMAMHACQIGPTDTAPPCPGSPQQACVETKGASTGAKIRKSCLTNRSRARKRQSTLEDATVKEGRIAKVENTERGSKKVADEEEPATTEEESPVAEDMGCRKSRWRP